MLLTIRNTNCKPFPTVILKGWFKKKMIIVSVEYITLRITPVKEIHSLNLLM